MGTRNDTLQTSFVSGEISPMLLGRPDLAKYRNGAAHLRNFLIPPQGGLIRRPPTKYLAGVYNSAYASRLIPFRFSDEQAYVLEFSQNVMRILKNGAVVQSGGLDVVVATPWTASDLSKLSFAQSADVLYVAHPDYQPRKISRFSDTSWTIETFSPEDGPYLDTNDGDITLTLSAVADTATVTCDTAIFVAGDVGKHIEWKENGFWYLGRITSYVSTTVVTVDVLPSYQPPDNGTPVFYAGATNLPPLIDARVSGAFKADDVGKYARSNTGDWYQITDMSRWDFLGQDVAQGQSATLAATATPLGGSDVGYTVATYAMAGSYDPASHKCTVSGREVTAVVTSSQAVFGAQDIGRLLRVGFSGEWTWGAITTYISTTIVGVTLEVAVPIDNRPTATAGRLLNITAFTPQVRDNGITKTWRLGAWSDTTGWPRAVTFHGQRLVFAGTTFQPQTVWMSVVADFPNFAPTEPDSVVLDTSAITYTVSSREVNPIIWLSSGSVLLIGTAGNEFQVRANTINEAITPTNINVSPQTTFGSKSDTLPVTAFSATIFLQRTGRQLREMVYDFSRDSFVARDLTVVSEHILRENGGGLELAYQQAPNSFVWVRLGNGKLACVTYEPDQEVVAWHLHEIGGSAVVESITVIPSQNQDQDDLYMVCRRTVNGTIRRWIERLDPVFQPTSPTDKSTMVFLDSYQSVTPAGSTTEPGFVDEITGLTRFTSAEVGLILDEAVRPKKTVDLFHKIYLTRTGTAGFVGFPYESQLLTIPMDTQLQTGTGQGRRKKMVNVTFRLLHSMTFSYGRTSDDTLTSVSFRPTTSPMGSSPELFTGVRTETLGNGFRDDATVWVETDNPYPLNLLSLGMQIHTNET